MINAEDTIKRIEEYRIKKRMNQSEMADFIGVNKGLYSLIINGKRPITKSFLEKLCVNTNTNQMYWEFGIEAPDELNFNPKPAFELTKKFLDFYYDTLKEDFSQEILKDELVKTALLDYEILQRKNTIANLQLKHVKK